MLSFQQQLTEDGLDIIPQFCFSTPGTNNEEQLQKISRLSRRGAISAKLILTSPAWQTWREAKTLYLCVTLSERINSKSPDLLQDLVHYHDSVHVQSIILSRIWKETLESAFPRNRVDIMQGWLCRKNERETGKPVDIISIACRVMLWVGAEDLLNSDMYLDIIQLINTLTRFKYKGNYNGDHAVLSKEMRLLLIDAGASVLNCVLSNQRAQEFARMKVIAAPTGGLWVGEEKEGGGSADTEMATELQTRERRINRAIYNFFETSMYYPTEVARQHETLHADIIDVMQHHSDRILRVLDLVAATSYCSSFDEEGQSRVFEVVFLWLQTCEKIKSWENGVSLHIRFAQFDSQLECIERCVIGEVSRMRAKNYLQHLNILYQVSVFLSVSFSLSLSPSLSVSVSVTLFLSVSNLVERGERNSLSSAV